MALDPLPAPPHPLLDPDGITPAFYDRVAADLGSLLDTTAEVILLPAEATFALEAVARALGRPDRATLNLVSGPYGSQFGGWLAESGGRVPELRVAFDTTPDPGQVADALNTDREIGVVCLAHAEAATGTVADLQAIAAVAHEHGALVAVDAVASVAADSLDLDGWGIDLCVVGPQKGLAGPAGVSAVLVAPSAWAWMAANPVAPRRSALSLLDWREGWLDTDRTRLPVIPAPLEVLALEACLERAGRESLDGSVARHRAAARATRAGLEALDLEPWVADPSRTAGVATTLRRPASGGTWAPGAFLSPGVGPLAEHLVRVDHTGRAARLDVVLGALDGLADRTEPPRSPADRDGAHRAATEAWSADRRNG